MSTLAGDRRKGRKKEVKKEGDKEEESRQPTQSQRGAVKKMIERFEEKLDAAELKMSVGDYIRLVQLHNELEEEDPKEIRVTWVEPKEKGSSTEE